MGPIARAATIAIVALLGAASANAAILLTQWDSGSGPRTTELRSQVDGILCCGSSIEIATPSSIPFSLAQVAQADILASATTYDFSASVLEIQMTHERDRRSTVASYGEIYFSVDRDSQFALSGVYSRGLGSGQLSARLSDLSTSTTLFENQLGGPQGGDVLTLGDPGALLIGSPTGALVAGHTYWFSYYTSIYSTESSDGAASAMGALQIEVVPEASASLLGSTTLLALVVARVGIRLR